MGSEDLRCTECGGSEGHVIPLGTYTRHYRAHDCWQEFRGRAERAEQQLARLRGAGKGVIEGADYDPIHGWITFPSALDPEDACVAVAVEPLADLLAALAKEVPNDGAGASV